MTDPDNQPPANDDKAPEDTAPAAPKWRPVSAFALVAAEAGAAKAAEVTKAGESSPDTDAGIPFSTADLPGQLEILKTPDSPVPSRPAESNADSLIAPFALGETEGVQTLTGLDSLKQAALQLVSQAQREVLIVSMDLELPRFSNEEFASQLSTFARSSRHTVTRILVGDPQLAVKEGHKLVTLSRRLSSLIQIRQMHENDLDDLQAWLIADGMGVLRCTNRDPWTGTLNAKAIPHAKHFRDQFQEWWARAEEVADFRDLRI